MSTPLNNSKWSRTRSHFAYHGDAPAASTKSRAAFGGARVPRLPLSRPLGTSKHYPEAEGAESGMEEASCITLDTSDEDQLS